LHPLYYRLEHNQLSIQQAPGALSPGVKRPGSEADHSPPYSYKAKNAWSDTSISPNACSWRGTYLRNECIFMVWCLAQHRNILPYITLPPSLLSKGYQTLFPWG
jgi:hypothetical protein